MSLQVIGAGLGRTGTLSLKFALEHLGFGPCYHATEVAANMRTALPLWNAAERGTPDWPAIFAGYRSSTDHPGCYYWRQLIEAYPQAKVVLTVRDPDSWFESVTQTILVPGRKSTFLGPEGEAFSSFLRQQFGGRNDDRASMIEYFTRWNREVVATVPAERLLVFSAKQGWAPLCAFLDVPVPAQAYPHLHARPRLRWFKRVLRLPDDIAARERHMRDYLDALHQDLFG
ncbi:hypothetical protein E4A48_13480 [Xanthomonas cerealis pv. cerealis]|uniref:Sulfotransferase family protein n=1 Tax=Xanthomonas cerealis pv. cerealis TaxID=152263 RepID=A0A514EFP7_9XANT|nr:sulfotransferase family protein [Xanthomonas translucens]QDI04563.1 hypothetical protein E4A48_13480 [Xanthomonas translucens pv. cerealis]